MRIKCLLTSGYLDISSQEPYQGNIPETLPFRLTLRPGQVVDIQDEYRNLRNIDSAIRSGLLQVLNYDSSDGSLVVNAELKKPYNTMKLDDLADVNAPSPTNLQVLMFDETLQTWIPGTSSGGGEEVAVLNLFLEFNIIPLESPNGINKKFTLPDSKKYVSTKIRPYINGQVLNLEDFTEDSERTFITLNETVPAPRYGDNIRLHYFEDAPLVLATMIFDAIPLEYPDGSNKTFTLPSCNQFLEDKIEVYLNGNVLTDEDYDQNPGYTSITLKASVPAPKIGDKIRFNYLRYLDPFKYLIFHEMPVETPDGVIKIFTLPDEKKYISGKISVSLNGQILTHEDFDEISSGRQIVLKIDVSAPLPNDNIRFYYIKLNT